MFDERTFISYKQEQWKDLSNILERAKLGMVSLRALPPSDLQRIGTIYRRTCADLAYLRTQHATPELISYLNELVGDAHGLLYVDEGGTNGFPRVIRFFTQSLPAVLRRRMNFIAIAFFITVIGTLFAYAIVRSNPANLTLFMPAEFKGSVEAWKRGFADHGDIPIAEGGLFSSYLMAHNTQVAVGAFATGITTVLPAYMMFQNGAIMGALIAVVQPTGNLPAFWAGILPHGVCELTAIFIAGGAGLLVGWALINPGPYSRKDALVANGKDAVKMMVATVPLLIVAGIIEGNVSHSSAPHFLKFSLAAVEFAAMTAYVYLQPGAIKNMIGTTAPGTAVPATHGDRSES
jgi:uncharacterized membrane protein SpoIIM required for sporulation